MNCSTINITKAKTPFLYACKYGTLDEVRALLADPATDPGEGNSVALFIAVKKDSPELLELLLKDGRADPTVANGALYGKALKTGNVDLLGPLTDDPRVKIPNDISLLITAIACNYHSDYGILDELVHIDPSVNDNAALFAAIRYENQDALDMILPDPRVNPAHNDNAALKYAIEVGYSDALHMMLSDPRVAPSKDDNALIKIAAWHLRIEDETSLLYNERARCAGRLLMEPSVVAGTLPLKELGGIEAAKKIQADAHRFYTHSYFWKAPMPEIKEPAPAPAPAPEPAPAPAPEANAPAPEPAPEAKAPAPDVNAEVQSLRASLRALHERLSALESRIAPDA